jgi:hypothetical protein
MNTLSIVFSEHRKKSMLTVKPNGLISTLTCGDRLQSCSRKWGFRLKSSFGFLSEKLGVRPREKNLIIAPGLQLEASAVHLSLFCPSRHVLPCSTYKS